jgi:hypothetical protein
VFWLLTDHSIKRYYLVCTTITKSRVSSGQMRSLTRDLNIVSEFIFDYVLAKYTIKTVCENPTKIQFFLKFWVFSVEIVLLLSASKQKWSEKLLLSKSVITFVSVCEIRWKYFILFFSIQLCLGFCKLKAVNSDEFCVPKL